MRGETFGCHFGGVEFLDGGRGGPGGCGHAAICLGRRTSKRASQAFGVYREVSRGIAAYRFLGTTLCVA